MTILDFETDLGVAGVLRMVVSCLGSVVMVELLCLTFVSEKYSNDAGIV